MKHKEFEELANELESACGDWEEGEGLSEEAMASLIAKVEALDAADQAEYRKRKTRVRLRKRYVIALAAVLVLLMGTGVVGERVWIADSRDLERESEVTTKVDNEEKEDVLLEEEAIYQEIAEKLGIATMRLAHMPDGMVLNSYSVTESTGWAYVFYLYQEKLICIQMFKQTEESAGNVQWDGEKRIIESIQNDYGYAELMEAYCVDDENGNYGVNIEYGNGYYNLLGSFDSEEQFLEILRGIYFKNL